MSVKTTKATCIPWACPKCGAKPDHHGKGGADACLEESTICQGLICECEDEGGDDHGETFAEPCRHANCYHCGWGGTVPQRPKGLQAWEKKAPEAGWVMPESRRKELGLP